MKIPRQAVVTVLLLLPSVLFSQKDQPKVDWDVVAKIREEGLQRSQVMDIVGYLTDVLGSRLSLSEHIKQAQIWSREKMGSIGLANVVIEPFMDYGNAWDNEYFSLQMLEADVRSHDGLSSRLHSRNAGEDHVSGNNRRPADESRL